MRYETMLVALVAVLIAGAAVWLVVSEAIDGR